VGLVFIYLLVDTMFTLTANAFKLLTCIMLTATLPTLTVAAAALSGTQIRLDEGTFVGIQNGSINRFLGIPFAKPP
jgi:hypothetical protein